MFEKIPATRPARWRRMKSIIRTWLRPLTAADGFTQEELKQMEAKLPGPLPRALREWYQLAGKARDIWSTQDSLGLPFIDREVLVFCFENQGIWRMGVRLSDLGQDDPPVFGWMNEGSAGASQFGQLNASVSECALQYLAWCLKWANLTKIRRLLGIEYYDGYGFWKSATLSAIERQCVRCAFPVWKLWGWDTAFYETKDLLIQVRHQNESGTDSDLYVAVRTKAALARFERMVRETGFGWAADAGWYTKEGYVDEFFAGGVLRRGESMTVLRGSVHCECGYVHDLEECPGPTIWRALRDGDGGDFRAAYRAQDRLQQLAPGSPEYQSLLWADGQMDRILTYVFECPQCGRLIWNRGEKFPDRVYMIEKERVEPNAAPGRGGK